MKITIPLWITPLSHQANIGIRNTKFGAMTYKKAKLADFQQQFSMLLRSEVNKQHFKRIDGPYGMSTTLFLKNRKKPDLTNMYKTLEDSCEGLLFTNDKNCHEQLNYIFYDAKNPRVEIECWPLDENTLRVA